MAAGSTMAMLILVLFSLSSAMVLAGSDPSDCSVVQTGFTDCISYLTGAEVQAARTCCDGIKFVNNLTRFSLHKLGTCECLQQEMTDAGATTTSSRIADLAEDCRVTVDFTIPTGPDFDCTVH